jgi:hypothetical protein
MTPGLTSGGNGPLAGPANRPAPLMFQKEEARRDNATGLRGIDAYDERGRHGVVGCRAPHTVHWSDWFPTRSPGFRSDRPGLPRFAGAWRIPTRKPQPPVFSLRLGEV